MAINFNDRPMSGFPVSIGTGLSLETLFTPIQEVFDEERTVPKLENPKEYDVYMFNVATILRNLLSNYKFDELFNINRRDLIETLFNEIDFIKMHFLSQELVCVFYLNSYQTVMDMYKDKDVLRTNKTDKQFYLESLREFCYKALRKRDDIILVDSSLPPSKKDIVMVFTHIPYDLLSFGKFRRLDLLESNSGVIKPRQLWNTKYYKVPGEDMTFLPFQEYLLSVFGDNVMFKPSNIQKRKELIQQLKARKVHPMTSVFSTEIFLKS